MRKRKATLARRHEPLKNHSRLLGSRIFHTQRQREGKTCPSSTNSSRPQASSLPSSSSSPPHPLNFILCPILPRPPRQLLSPHPQHRPFSLLTISPIQTFRISTILGSRFPTKTPSTWHGSRTERSIRRRCRYNAGHETIRVASSVSNAFIMRVFPIHHSIIHPQHRFQLSTERSNEQLLNSSLSDYEVPTSYSHTLVTPSSPSVASFPVPLSPYRKYSPCQLKLQDPEDSESVTGVAIFISQQTNASTQGVTWDVDNPAPKVAVDAGVATTQTSRAGMNHRGVGGGVWTLLGAAAMAMMLS